MFDSTRHLGLDEVLELIDAICLSWAGGAREQGLEKKNIWSIVRTHPSTNKIIPSMFGYLLPRTSISASPLLQPFLL